MFLQGASEAGTQKSSGWSTPARQICVSEARAQAGCSAHVAPAGWQPSENLLGVKPAQSHELWWHQPAPSSSHQLSSSITICVLSSRKSNLALRLMDLRFSTWKTGINSRKAERACVAGSHCVVFCLPLFYHLLCVEVFLNGDMEVAFPVELSSEGVVSE